MVGLGAGGTLPAVEPVVCGLGHDVAPSDGLAGREDGASVADDLGGVGEAPGEIRKNGASGCDGDSSGEGWGTGPAPHADYTTVDIKVEDTLEAKECWGSGDAVYLGYVTTTVAGTAMMDPL